MRHQQGLDMGGTFEGSTVVALVSAPTESYAAEVLADGEDHEYRVFALSREDDLFFYHTDHLGTPIAMADDGGDLVWRGEHRPFGELFSLPTSIVNNLRFPGQYFDVETGLHQNYFRDYDPGIGRYREPDPIGQRDGTNLYSYGGNDPTGVSDPLGLWGIEVGSLQLGDDRPWAVFDSTSLNSRDLERGLAATADGVLSAVTINGLFNSFNPNLFEDHYDRCESDTQWSHALGEWSVAAASLAFALPQGITQGAPF